MNRRPMITAEHVEDGETVETMQGHVASFPGVEVRVQYRHGDHAAALGALERAAGIVRQQIAATVGDAVIVGGPDAQDEPTHQGSQASEGGMIVDYLYRPGDLRAALAALLHQNGGRATIPGDVVDGRPQGRVRATRSGVPPYDVALELVTEDQP